MDDKQAGAERHIDDEAGVLEDCACCGEGGLSSDALSWRACKSDVGSGGRDSLPGSDSPSGDAGASAKRNSGIPLAIVGTGRKVKLLALQTGRECAARLAAMGLVPGAEIEVLRNASHGPFMVAVKGSRVVLGRGVAQRIIVG